MPGLPALPAVRPFTAAFLVAEAPAHAAVGFTKIRAYVRRVADPPTPAASFPLTFPLLFYVFALLFGARQA